MGEEQTEEDFCNSFPDLNQTMEYSINRRFSRTSIIIAEGMFKTVFLGYDHDSGREIAWSTIKGHALTARNRERILEDLTIFSKLDHPNVLKLIASWEDVEKGLIITITELTTCSIKYYLQNKVKTPRLKVIKSWCKSILEGIAYLHSRLMLHKNIKSENIFIGRSDGNIRIGIIGSSNPSKQETSNIDLRGLAFTLIEICTMVDLDYSKIFLKTLPKEIAMVENEMTKVFITACFCEDSAGALLEHPFLRNEDAIDLSPAKALPISDFYDISIEEIPKSIKFYILVWKNFQILGKDLFNYHEDMTEPFVETLIKKYNLPMPIFQEVLNKIEKHLVIIQASYIESHGYSQVTLATDSKSNRKQKLSINLGIHDLNSFKKLKVDVIYDQETDTPKSIAEEIISHFQLDHSEIDSVSKLINEKLYNSESETHSNYSNQDLLDLTQEDTHHSRPGFNSTAEFSMPSENSSYRSSIEPQGPQELSYSRSISPFDEEDKVVVCGRGRKNDPREVKQLQDALASILGFKIQNDGIFCKKLEEQVKLLQEQLGLIPTGVVCSKLWQAIINKTIRKLS